MRKYKSVEVSERELEDLVRQGAELIEGGLRYVDHQVMTERGPLDVLMVDSGRALVVLELKSLEDDSMLVQGLDYYDSVHRNLHGLVRAYKEFDIDPDQPVRLLLIAPSFPVSLLNRCRWIDVPLSLFAYKCIVIDGLDGVVPVYHEVTTPPIHETVKPPRVDERLSYITDPEVKKMAQALIEEIKSWNPARITVEATKSDLSFKVSARVFAYVTTRRKFFIVWTCDSKRNWTAVPIHGQEELESVKTLVKGGFDRLSGVPTSGT